MQNYVLPAIDPVATGRNIVRLRKLCGLSVKDLQHFFGFAEPQAIYKWQRGESLPCVDNLYALGTILHVTVDEILIPAAPPSSDSNNGSAQQAKACCAFVYRAYSRSSSSSSWRISLR